MGRTIVLLQTHLWDRRVREKLARLRREIGGGAEVAVLLERTRETARALAAHPDSYRVYLYGTATLPNVLGFPYFQAQRFVPGSAHFALLAFYRARPDYEAYFLIEHDVEFTGNWGELFERVTDAPFDFVSSHVGRYENDPEWTWWKKYRPAPEDLDWARDVRNLRRSFNPIYRISRRCLELVDEAHRRGWRAHHELLIATLVAHHGCRVGDFAEIGAYYVGTRQDPDPTLTRAQHSTLRWRPAIVPRELHARSTGQTLFHPVKGWAYDGTRIVGYAEQASLDQPAT